MRFEKTGEHPDPVARIAGFDGAYMRFTGHVTVEHVAGDAGPGTVTAPGLWS